MHVFVGGLAPLRNRHVGKEKLRKAREMIEMR